MMKEITSHRGERRRGGDAGIRTCRETMSDSTYSKKGSLYKAQQPPGKEPHAPLAQDIRRVSKSTQYLALHQTIYSSLKPLSNFFDPLTTDRSQILVLETEQGAPPRQRLDRSFFSRIAEQEPCFADEPSRRLYRSCFNRFVGFMLHHTRALPAPSATVPQGEETDFSSLHQHDFYSPRPLFDRPGTPEPGKSPDHGGEISWNDHLKDALFGIFGRLLTPWMERILMEREKKHHLQPPETSLEFSIYEYLSILPDHSWAAPPPVTLLSGYEEIEEIPINDDQVRFILRPRSPELENIEILYDIPRNIFIVSGKGYSRTAENGQPLNPQVIVDAETGKETRVYWVTTDEGLSIMEIEDYDMMGNLIAVSTERSLGEDSRHVQECIYEEGFIRESTLDVHLKNDLDIRRSFTYAFNDEGYLKHIEEESTITIPALKSINDLGMADLRESSILAPYCEHQKVDMEIVTLWAPRGNDVSAEKRKIALKVQGSVEASMEESFEQDYFLNSEIKDGRGKVLFKRHTARDLKKRMLLFTIEDREQGLRWKQTILLGRDDTPLSMHTTLREPSEWDMNRGGNLFHDHRVTHLLPGSILSAVDRTFDTVTHKENTRMIYYFDKLLDTQWIKPQAIKKTDSGEIIVNFKYELSPRCFVEEQRHYGPFDDNVYEIASAVRKKIPSDTMTEERTVKRDIDKGEETSEIVRKKLDMEYQETTGFKEGTVDRFIRSRKRTDRLPSSFFSESNKWLELMTAGHDGVQSFVSTYVHERINTTKHPSPRMILIREETYEADLPGREKRDILNFLAFLDEEGVTHYRTKATAFRQDFDRTITWEDGELIGHQEVPRKEAKPARKAHEPLLGSVRRRK
jgi:hypothetical protein